MLPQSAIPGIEIQTEQPSLTWGIDFEKGKVTGMIDEKEAIKQAVFLVLDVQRFRYLALSWFYGIETDDLIGAPVTYAYLEIERRIREALMIDDRVKSVTDFAYKKNKNEVTVTFTVNTTLGEIEAERTVVV